VSLEIATLCSSIPTARLITGVGPLPCVSAHVSLEAVAPLSAIATARDGTGVCGHGEN
jgi:hypothetical protein